MKPETTSHLNRATVFLAKANIDITISIQQPIMAEDAARNAYYAAFHAAKALIFERTGRTHKSHGGVHAGFNQLSRTEPDIDHSMRTFLSIAYDFKRLSDYDIGQAGQVPPSIAADAVKEAERFVAVVRQLLTPPSTPSAPPQ